MHGLKNDHDLGRENFGLEFNDDATVTDIRVRSPWATGYGTWCASRAATAACC
jgi:hypothetical protein